MAGVNGADSGYDKPFGQVGGAYMAFKVPEAPVKKTEESIHTTKERPVDLSSVSCWC